MTTTTAPTATERLSWLLEALRIATERQDWRTARDHTTEAAAIIANRARFDRRAS